MIRVQPVEQDRKTIMADPYPIRPIADSEFAAYHAVDQHAFHGGPPRAAELPLIARLFEADRSLAAFDPALPASAGPVGNAGAYTFQMSVPGGLLPTAGVTYVAVLPTYRRRGILRSLMRRQLTDIAAKGEPIAALWASETPLYWRYGYGRATVQATFRFGRGEGALSALAPADPALRLRIVEPAAAAAELAKVYETALQQQPGFFTRNDAWWDRLLYDPEEDRHGFSPQRCLLAEDDSGPRGYALYRAQGRWDDDTFLPDSLLDVRELVATDPAAGAALWRDLLSRDLLSEVTARLRPVDDPVLFQLLDPRRARPQLHDGLWVRIIDLPAALTRRAYSCPVDVVLEVTDELLPDNAGRWRLRADGTEGGVTCERTGEPADIALDVRELGAAYLGGTRLGALAAAGLVRQSRPGTLAPLSAAMSWDPGPWCPRIF
jgi:predicted acetyltransferase